MRLFVLPSIRIQAYPPADILAQRSILNDGKLSFARLFTDSNIFWGALLEEVRLTSVSISWIKLSCRKLREENIRGLRRLSFWTLTHLQAT